MFEDMKMKTGYILFALVAFFFQIVTAFGQADLTPRIGITVRLDANTAGCGGLTGTATVKLAALNPSGTPSLSVSGTASGVPTNCGSPFVLYQNSSLSFAPTQVALTVNGTPTPYDFYFVKRNDIGEINGHTAYHYPTAMPVTQQIGNYTFLVNMNIPQIPQIGVYADAARTVMTDRVCYGELLYGDTPYKNSPITGASIEWETSSKQFNGSGPYYSDFWQGGNNNTGVVQLLVSSPTPHDTSSVFVRARLKLLIPGTSPAGQPGWGVNDKAWKGPWSPTRKVIVYPQLAPVNVMGIDSIASLSMEANLTETNSDNTFHIHHVSCYGGDNGKIVIDSLNKSVDRYFITVRNKTTRETMNYKLRWSPSHAHPLVLPDDAFRDVSNANAPFHFKSGSYEILLQYINPDNGLPFGCVSRQIFKIKQPDMLQANISKLKYHGFDVSCYRENTTGTISTDGRIQVEPIGGIGPFDLVLKGYANGNRIFYDSVRSPGSYQFTRLAPLHATTAIDYVLTLTDISGCIARNMADNTNEFRKEYHSSAPNANEQSLRMTVPPPINIQEFDEDISRYHGHNIKCFGETDNTEVIITGGTQRFAAWLEGNGVSNDQRRDSVNEGGDRLFFTALAAGNYLIHVVDRNGCQAVQSFTFSQPAKIEIENSSITPATCNGNDAGVITINGKGGVPLPGGTRYRYTLHYDATNPSRPWPSDFDPSPPAKRGMQVQFDKLIAGDYTISISDTLSCTQPYPLALGEPAALHMSADQNKIACYGTDTGWVEANATGGVAPYTLQWLDVQKNIITSVALTNPGDQHKFENQYAGGYYLKLFDAHDCVLEQPINISQPAAPLDIYVRDSDVRQVTCHGANNGQITLQTTGGWTSSPYEIGMNKNNLRPSNSFFSNLSPGTYRFYVRDSNPYQCMDSVDVTIVEPLRVSILPDVEPVSCYGKSDGAFFPVITGGTAPYEISSSSTVWEPVRLVDGLSSGTYAFYVRDARACMEDFDVTIPSPDTLQSKLQSSVDTHCGEATGEAKISITGGNAPYDTQWTLEGKIVGEGLFADRLRSGIYQVNVEDAKHCQNMIYIGISDSEAPTISTAYVTNLTCFGGADGVAAVSVTGGSLPYSEVAWSNGQRGTVANSLSAGTYIASVKDQQGCTATRQIEVQGPQKIQAIFRDIVPPHCFGDRNGSLGVEAVGGTAPYQYHWVNSQNESDHIAQVGAGPQSVIITDFNACVLEAKFELSQPRPVEVQLTSAEFFCTGQTASLDARNPGATYQWTSSIGVTSTDRVFKATETGTYTVIVTDERGCQGTDSYDLVFDSNILQADFLSAMEAVAGDTIVFINVSFPLPDSSYWSFSHDVQIIESSYFVEQVIFPSPGVYDITLSASKGECFDQMTGSIAVSEKKDAGDVDNSGRKKGLISSFTLHPNPSNGKFKISVRLHEVAPVEIEIFSNDGIPQAAYQDTGSREYEIDAEVHVPPGAYTVWLKSGKERQINRVIIY